MHDIEIETVFLHLKLKLCPTLIYCRTLIDVEIDKYFAGTHPQSSVRVNFSHNIGATK